MRKTVLLILGLTILLIISINHIQTIYFTQKSIKQRIIPQSIDTVLTVERLLKASINTIKLEDAVKDRDLKGFTLSLVQHLRDILLLYIKLNGKKKIEQTISNILASYRVPGYIDVSAINERSKMIYYPENLYTHKRFSHLYSYLQTQTKKETGYITDIPKEGLITGWCKIYGQNIVLLTTVHKKAISMLNIDKIREIDRNILKKAVESLNNATFYVSMYDKNGTPISYPSKLAGEEDLPGSPIVTRAIRMRNGAFSYKSNETEKTKIVVHLPAYDWYVILTILTGKLVENIAKSTEIPNGLSIVVILMLFFTVIYLIAERWMIKPLKEVSKGLEKISMGNFGFRLNLEARHEMKTIITDFNRMAERIEQYNKNRENTAKILKTSLQIFTEVARLETKEEIAKKTAQILEKVKKYKHVVIAVVEGNRVRAIHSTNIFKKIRSISINEGIMGLAARTKEIQNIPDVRKEPRYIQVSQKIKSELAVPIIDRNIVVGVIDIESEELSAFDDTDEQVINMMASFIAVAFRKVQLFNELKSRLSELESLFNIIKSTPGNISIKEISDSIVREIAKRRGYSGIAMLILEGKKLNVISYLWIDKSKNFPIKSFDMDGKGIVVRAAKTGKIQNVGDTSKDSDFIRVWKETVSELAVPIKVKNTVVGVLNIESSTPNAFNKHEENFFRSIADITANVIHAAKGYQDIKRAYKELKEMENKLQSANTQLENYIKKLEDINIQIQKKTEELEASYIQTVKALVRTIETKDKYTKGHSERVAKLSVEIAKRLELSEDTRKKILYAGLLHDIGKIGIKEEILNKPVKLTPEEYEEIKKHPVLGAKIVKEIDYLKDIYTAVLHHHERWDGKGYPNGLKGENIPLFARILATADAYDAMTSERAYRKARSTKEAIKELENGSGKQFDPHIARILIKILKGDERNE